jgi:hypothetical protein
VPFEQSIHETLDYFLKDVTENLKEELCVN